MLVLSFEPYRLSEEGQELTTILTALMALLADHVMDLAATSRRRYLVEFNHYLDERAKISRPKRRRTPA